MIDDFTPGNELEEVFVQAATDPAARVDFYRRLLASEIYVLTEDSALAGGASNRETSATSTLVTWDGPTGPYVPLFSSRARVDEISKARERAFGYVAMRDWGCKTGAIHDGCPVVRDKTPARVDIPA